MTGPAPSANPDVAAHTPIARHPARASRKVAKDRQGTRLARGRDPDRPAGYEYLEVGASAHGTEPAQKTSAKVTVLRKASQHGHHPGTCHHARRVGAAHWPDVHGPAGASAPGAPWAAAGPHRRAMGHVFLRASAPRLIIRGMSLQADAVQT